MDKLRDRPVFHYVDIGSGWTAEIKRTDTGAEVTLRNDLRVSPIQLSETMTERLVAAITNRPVRR